MRHKKPHEVTLYIRIYDKTISLDFNNLLILSVGIIILNKN